VFWNKDNSHDVLSRNVAPTIVIIIIIITITIIVITVIIISLYLMCGFEVVIFYKDA
jgi:hypothetical protein